VLTQATLSDRLCTLSPRMSSLGTPVLVVVFAAGAGATWLAGVALSKTTDALDRRFGFGDAIGGLVLLSLAGSLPELAITISAAAKGDLGLAAGNLIGGIAVQTMVLVLCDAAASGDRPLTYLVGSLVPVLEGVLVVFLVAVTMMGALLPTSVELGPISPASIAIVVAWLSGIAMINRTRKAPAWRVDMPGSEPGRPHHMVAHPDEQPRPITQSAGRAGLVFGVACVITLGAGVVLEVAGDTLASRAGMNGVIFGATVLAVATALPEISSGIAAVGLGDNQLAVGDIFGGNAFQVCLFLLADLVAGKAVLPAAGPLNAWLAALGIALTMVFAFGVVTRPTRCRARLGPDSLLAIAVFAVGIAGLVAVSHG
jgi:cation:H+ antiporter